MNSVKNFYMKNKKKNESNKSYKSYDLVDFLLIQFN